MELLLPKFQAQECPDIATEQPLLLHHFLDIETGGQIGAAARILAPERVKNELARFAAFAHPDLQRNGESHLVLALTDRLGKHILESDAQQALQFAVLEFHIGGHRRDQFDQLVIKERHARLDAVRHAHPVFYLQQGWQQRLEIEMGDRIEV